jgi:hypothetical protein
MMTGAIKGQIDQIWDAFRSGGISNPLEVIEQITYLLFLRRLDDLHTLEENKAARSPSAPPTPFKQLPGALKSTAAGSSRWCEGTWLRSP